MIAKPFFSLTKRIFLSVVLLNFFQSIFSQCADAGSDTIVCGFNYRLVGLPSSGHWTYLCNGFSEPVALDSITQDSLNVKVGTCGVYTFIYHLNEGSCISSDTVTIAFENTSFRTKEISYNINLFYPSSNCNKSPADVCGNVRELIGIIPPKPNWELRFFGKCESFAAQSVVHGLDTTGCLADSIVLSLKTNNIHDTLDWNTSQDGFIEFANGQINKNRFNSFFNFINSAILSELDQKCSLIKCLNINKVLCTDTTLIDTFQVVVPVHRGGRWYLYENNNFTTLNDSTMILIGAKSYVIIFPKGVKYLGPENFTVELFEKKSNGDLIPVEDSIIIKLKWKEEWQNDTIPFYQIREVDQDKCFCNGTLINFSTFTMPSIPEYHCDSICLKFSKVPKVKIIGNSVVCNGGFTRLDANDFFNSYKWSNGDETRSTNIFQPGWVYLTVTDEVGCKSVDSILMQGSDLPVFTHQADKSILCRGECTELKVVTDSLNKVIWNSIDTARSIIICPTQDVNNFIRVINPYGCISESQLLIKVFNAPKPVLGSDQRLTCTIKSVLLTPVDADLGINRIHIWTGPGIVGNQVDSINVRVNVAGKYIFTIIDTLTKCVGYDSLEVISDTIAPIANAGPDLFLNCKNPRLNLQGDSSMTGAGFSLIWSGPSINAGNRNEISPSVTRTGTYVIRIRNTNNNCESSDTAIVSSDFTTPIAVAGPNVLLFCDSSFVTIGNENSSSGNDYFIEWSGPAIDSTNKSKGRVMVNLAGQYTLVITHKISMCSDTSIVMVSEPDTLANIVLTKTTDLGCNVDSVVLRANQSIGKKLRFAWSGPKGFIGIGADSIVVNAIGKYYLFIYDSTTHCSDFDSIIVSDNGGRPIVNAGPDRTLTCEIINVILAGSVNTAPNFSKVEWSGPGIGANPSMIQTLVSVPGQYILKVTDTRNNCDGVDTMYVREDLIIPELELGQDFTLNCVNDSVRLLAKINNNKPSYVFRWAGPGVTNNNQSTNPLLITIPGTYSAIINTANPKCVAFDTVRVSIDTAHPKLDIQDTIWMDCENRNYFYKVNNLSKIDSISWFDFSGLRLNSTNLGSEINFTKEGRVIYKVYYSNGCVLERTVIVNVYAKVEVGRLIVKPSCSNMGNGSIEIIDVFGIAPFKFEFEGSKADTIRKFTNLNPGKYKIRIFDHNGENTNCFKDIFVDVDTVQSLPAIQKVEDTIVFCIDTILNARKYFLNVTPNFSFDSLTYDWLLDDKVIIPRTESILISNSGNYKLTIKSKNGCGEHTFNIHIEKFNDVVISSDSFNFCRDSSLSARIVFEAAQSNLKFDSLSYEWKLDDKVISQNKDALLIDKPGIYQLHVKNGRGCGEFEFNYKAIQIQSNADTSLKIPNVFTPYEQTNNLYRLILDTSMLSFEPGTYQAKIFNRWGQVVFESADPLDSWDGTYKGVQQSTDTYFVMIKGILEVCGARKETIIKRSLNLIK